MAVLSAVGWAFLPTVTPLGVDFYLSGSLKSFPPLRLVKKPPYNQEYN
ncbi:MAG: hypothetical protein IJ143_08270 [Neisseriaceae bacterium]|nr:hypothetical protein [Neisseriaceae bacterium]